VTVVKLSPPEYPPIARAAWVIGHVELSIIIDHDGKVTAVEVKSGPQMLRNAAVISAENSVFRPVTGEPSNQGYEVTYVFELEPRDCDQPRDNSYPHVKYEANVITIAEQPVPICDPSGYTMVRSVKCLYLWRCGRR
jgi:TonB family protein